MNYLTIARIKQHLNIEPTYFSEDEYLAYLYKVAEQTVERHICQPLSSLEDADGQIPATLAHAILLYIGDLYANRESVAYGGNPQKVPFTYEYLVSMYINYGG